MIRKLTLMISVMLVLALLSIFAIGAVSAQVGEIVYTVQYGDTLRIIASRYNTTWDVIASRNGLVNPNLIYPGQQLIVPANVSNVPTQTYTVQSGESLYTIAAKFGITVTQLVQVNNLTDSTTLYAGQIINVPITYVAPTPVPTATPYYQPYQPPTYYRQVVNGYYWVRYGDTLYAIGASFGVDIWAIARANGILNLNSIYAGQPLLIPGY